MSELTFEEALDYSTLVDVVEDYSNTKVDTLDINSLFEMKQKLLQMQMELAQSIITHRKAFTNYSYQFKSKVAKKKREYMKNGDSGVLAEAKSRDDFDDFKMRELLHETYIKNYDLLYWQCKEIIDAISQHLSYLKDEKNRAMPRMARQRES